MSYLSHSWKQMSLPRVVGAWAGEAVLAWVSCGACWETALSLHVTGLWLQSWGKSRTHSLRGGKQPGPAPHRGRHMPPADRFL